MGSVGSNAGLHTYCKHAWSDKFAHAHVHGYGLSFACHLLGAFSVVVSLVRCILQSVTWRHDSI